MNRILKSLSVLLICVPMYAGTVTGTMTTPNGVPLKNGTISFSLAQAGLIIGTGAVVPVATACYTSTDGSVVGIANPLNAPHVSTSTSGGLPAGNYYAQLTAYATDGHETLASPEVVVSLPTGGSFTLTYEDPFPLGYTQGVKAYVATSSGAETLQGSTSGGTIYTQTAPLVSGAAKPAANSTICSIAFNDTIIPYSGYKVSLTSSAGNAYPGYPQLWQLNGGLSGTVNVSQGTPLWNGTVIYPQAIVAQPLNHGPQSISGPLGLSGYDIFGVGHLGIGTNNPAYPLDVHGGVANADQGYLVNGDGGTTGKCLGSDGTAYDMPISCLTSIGTIFYQTAQSHGSALTQRPIINFVAPLQAVDNAGATRTDVSVSTSGNGTKVVTQGTTLPGTTSNCAQYDGAGNLIPAAGPCTTNTVQSASNNTGCTTGSASYDVCPMSVTWPNAFVDTGYQVACTGIGPTDGGNPTSGRALMNGVTSKTTTGVTVQFTTAGSSPISFTGMDCIAVHP